MKKIPFFLLLLLSSFQIQAQAKLEDFGRIILNTYLPNNNSIPAEAKKALETKLNQITTNNGMGGSAVNPRFIITAVLNVGTKDIIPGPPQMIAQNIDVTLFVGDAITNTVFSNTVLSIKGVGTNENKSLIDAIKNINPKNIDISAFLEEGKNKIISYYITQCDFIIKDAETLAKQQKFDEAIYKLALVPEVCKECYFKCLDELTSIYQQKIDADCKSKFNEAKTTWSANQTPVGAEKAGDILSTINPEATCQTEITLLINNIDAKLKADEKARWQFKMKQYADKIAIKKEQIRIAEEKGKRDDIYRENQSKRDATLNQIQSARNFELDKIRANSYREIAVEQARNQPKTITYNNIYWR
jgi:predicted Rdx family selenoprotein